MRSKRLGILPMPRFAVEPFFYCTNAVSALARERSGHRHPRCIRSAACMQELALWINLYGSTQFVMTFHSSVSPTGLLVGLPLCMDFGEFFASFQRINFRIVCYRDRNMLGSILI